MLITDLGALNPNEQWSSDPYVTDEEQETEPNMDMDNDNGPKIPKAAHKGDPLDGLAQHEECCHAAPPGEEIPAGTRSNLGTVEA